MFVSTPKLETDGLVVNLPRDLIISDFSLWISVMVGVCYVVLSFD